MELGHVSGVKVGNCTPQVPVLTEQSLPAADDSTNNCGEMQQFLDGPNVYSVSTTMSSEHIKWRQQQLGKLLRSTKTQLSKEDYLLLETLLTDYHDLFSLEEDERGEPDIVEFEISTGDELPRKIAARRIPYAASQEVVEQLDRMQKTGVIMPSNSQWSSQVVLVRKRDGTVRFCVNYRLGKVHNFSG